MTEKEKRIRRFTSFIYAIVKAADWEYGDGEPMTEDAAEFCREWRRLRRNDAKRKGEIG